MERPRGVNLIYSGGGDPLCYALHRAEKDCTAKGSLHRGYMRDSRLKSKSGRRPHYKRLNKLTLSKKKVSYKKSFFYAYKNISLINVPFFHMGTQYPCTDFFCF